MSYQPYSWLPRAPWWTCLILAAALPAHAQAICENQGNPAVPATTPTADFIVHDDGTVTHRPTGLMWMRCTLGQVWAETACTGRSGLYTWQDALNAAHDFNSGGGYAGHADWRLPNKNELASIVEYRCSNPAINATVFPGTPPDWFWSSSPRAFHGSGAYDVNFAHGHVSTPDKGNDARVRLVRGGHHYLGEQLHYTWEKKEYPSIASGALSRVSSTVNHLPAGYAGVWRGRGVQTNPSSEWSILIGLSGSQVGVVVGAIAYPSLACGGELTLLEVIPESLMLHETITYGSCVDEGIITLSLGGPGNSGAGGH